MARPLLGANTAPTSIVQGDTASVGTAGANAALADHRHALAAYTEYSEIAIPAAPAADKLRVFVLDSNGHSVVAFIDSAGFSTTPMRDAFLIAKVDEAGGVTAGQAVYLSGASGATELIKKARADSAATMPAIGITAAAGAFNAFIKVLLLGKVVNINTSAFADGASLYVSATTAGVLTATAPSFPNRIQRIGYVTRSHATLGEILLTATNTEVSQVAHSALSGLSADDHPQYATDTDLTTHAATPHGSTTPPKRTIYSNAAGTSGTWTKTGSPKYIEVVVIGGGGGSGGGASTGSGASAVSGGGGGGAFSTATFDATSLGSVAYAAGAAGVQGNAGANPGSPGGNSHWGTTILTATGGGGASAATSTTGNATNNGGTGGTAGGTAPGAVLIPGGDGGNGESIGGIRAYTGTGGGSPYGPMQTPGNGAGRLGNGYGGGGGGAANGGSAGAVSGGPGAPGAVIVTEYY